MQRLPQEACLPAGRFPCEGNEWFVSEEKQHYIKRLLLERLSLSRLRRDRVMNVCLTWLMGFIKQLYAALPKDLNCKVELTEVKKNDKYYIKLFDNEADELWFSP